MYHMNGLGLPGGTTMREAPSWTQLREGLTTAAEIDAAKERVRQEYALKRDALEASQGSNTVLYLGIGAAVLAVLGVGYIVTRK